jgi:hypothetical protein
MTLRPFVGLLTAAMLSACGSDAVQSITAAPASAAVKFFNFGVGAPGVNLYANETKVTATSSTTGAESATGTAYGNAASGGFYTALAPGQYTFTGRLPATYTPAADAGKSISTLGATIADGKYYSLYQSGIYNTTAKTVESFIIDDPIPAVDYSVAYVRFVNAISNAQPMQLFAKSTVTSSESAVGGLVAYKAAGAFVALPPAAYDLNTRVAGSSTNSVTRTGVSFSAGHVYTVSARGDITSTATATKPALDLTANW